MAAFPGGEGEKVWRKGAEPPTVKHFCEQRGHKSPRHIVGFVGRAEIADQRELLMASSPDQGPHQFWRGSCWAQSTAAPPVSLWRRVGGAKRRGHFPQGSGAGLGQMEVHQRNASWFGNFILLGTVLVDAEVSEHSHRSFTTHVSNASCASLPVRGGAISPAGSISLPATRTTTASLWMFSGTGWKRLPNAAVPTNTGRRSYHRRWSRCGKVCRLAPTTGRRTVCSLP